MTPNRAMAADSSSRRSDPMPRRFRVRVHPMGLDRGMHSVCCVLKYDVIRREKSVWVYVTSYQERGKIRVAKISSSREQKGGATSGWANRQGAPAS